MSEKQRTALKSIKQINIDIHAMKFHDVNFNIHGTTSIAVDFVYKLTRVQKSQVRHEHWDVNTDCILSLYSSEIRYVRNKNL